MNTRLTNEPLKNNYGESNDARTIKINSKVEPLNTQAFGFSNVETSLSRIDFPYLRIKNENYDPCKKEYLKAYNFHKKIYHKPFDAKSNNRSLEWLGPDYLKEKHFKNVKNIPSKQTDPQASQDRVDLDTKTKVLTHKKLSSRALTNITNVWQVDQTYTKTPSGGKKHIKTLMANQLYNSFWNQFKNNSDQKYLSHCSTPLIKNYSTFITHPQSHIIKDQFIDYKLLEYNPNLNFDANDALSNNLERNHLKSDSSNSNSISSFNYYADTTDVGIYDNYDLRNFYESEKELSSLRYMDVPPNSPI
ncbi:unnamed protein product [Gordionus sp. m RMFG-2023]